MPPAHSLTLSLVIISLLRPVRCKTGGMVLAVVLFSSVCGVYVVASDLDPGTFSIVEQDGTYSLRANEANLYDVMEHLRDQVDIPFRIDPLLRDRTVTIDLKPQTLGDLVRKVAEGYALTYSQDGDGIRLTAASVASSQEAVDVPLAVARNVESPTPEDVGRQVIMHLAAGETESFAALFISTEEFSATFRDTNPEMYSENKTAFMTSVEKLTPQLRSARFVRMNMKFCPAPIPVKAGTDFGSAVFSRDTSALDNIRVIAQVDGQERELMLDAMVKTASGWKLLSPEIELLPVQRFLPGSQPSGR